jgi:hypothetical protein
MFASLEWVRVTDRVRVQITVLADRVADGLVGREREAQDQAAVQEAARRDLHGQTSKAIAI